MKLTYPTGYVVCKEVVEQNGGRVDEKAMVGTGPFKLESYQQGYRVNLTANADYHRGRPVLDGIIRPITVDPNTRQTSFESGELDYVDVQLAELSRIQGDRTLSKELKSFEASGITELHTAFSRAEGPKSYVQHLVSAQKERVWSLIENGAIIYVCGDGGKMEPDVKAALVAIYRERAGSDANGGQRWIEDLGAKNRYVLDVWAGG